MWQNVAFVLIGLGVLGIVGWSVQSFFMSSDIPVLVRVAVGIMGAGVLILIGVAIKDRITRAKDEDFKGVEK